MFPSPMLPNLIVGSVPDIGILDNVVLVHLTSRSLFDPIHSTKENQPSFLQIFTIGCEWCAW